MSDLDLENDKVEGNSLESTSTSDDVLIAVRRKDWNALRSLSLRPGGFGEDRKAAWPFLTHAETVVDFANDKHVTDSLNSSMRRRGRRSSFTSTEETSSGDWLGKDALREASVESHPDERQIKLDTDRSFVLYGVDDKSSVELAQARLNSLITTIFRRHPRLSYFQGYHDIITILFLTLHESDQLICAEKMSLHRLRDAMGKGLEPLLGLLHVLKYLIRLADDEYAALLERNTPLPYFALSNLLTLFSHDVPTLPLIQHVFDFLLSRPPIAVVYLAAAVTLARKDEVMEMDREGEDGMLHSVLSALPRLSDGDESNEGQGEACSSDTLDERLTDSGSAKEPSPASEEALSESNAHSDMSLLEKPETQEIAMVDQDDAPPTFSGISPGTLSEHESPTSHTRSRTESEPSLQTDETQSNTVPGSSIDSNVSSSDLRSSAPPSQERSPSRPTSPYPDPSSDHAPPYRKTTSLPALLQRADSLFEQYPPSHPALHVSAIMGPQSVVFTWSEDPNHLISDADAEAIPTHPELIVLPFVDPDEEALTKKENASEPGYIRRKLRKRMRKRARLDKKTVLTGTVVVLSVAIAIYSVRAKGNGGVLDVSRSDKAFRRTAKAVSGILIGGSERLLESFGW